MTDKEAKALIEALSACADVRRNQASNAVPDSVDHIAFRTAALVLDSIGAALTITTEEGTWPKVQ